MRDWFESLDARERIFVAAGALVVALAILYGLLWMPFDNGHRALQSEVSNWQQSLAELKPLKARLASGSAPQATVAASSRQSSPIIIVDQTLRSRGLDPYRRRSQPTSSNGIRVEFENVSFDELVLWLGDLSDQYAMHVQAGTFSVGTQKVPGRIAAIVTLERAP